MPLSTDRAFPFPLVGLDSVVASADVLDGILPAGSHLTVTIAGELPKGGRIETIVVYQAGSFLIDDTFPLAKQSVGGRNPQIVTTRLDAPLAKIRVIGLGKVSDFDAWFQQTKDEEPAGPGTAGDGNGKPPVLGTH